MSTGGFTQEAKYEAERSPKPVTLLTVPDLRNLLLDVYEDMPREGRDMVPLRRVYWAED